MLIVRVHGIKDGKSVLDLECDTSEIENISEEFFGKVNVHAVFTKVGKRYTLIGNAQCQAKLICDISLEEYDELINAEISYTFIANTESYMLRKDIGDYETDNGEIIVHEDDQFIDISDLIRQDLLLNLPIKRVSPNYRDKSFEDLHPELSSKNIKDDVVAERWLDLKKIKFSN
ncbi:MAG: YceD family protein [Candidatus Kapaibacteriota bacterium]